MKRYEKLTKDPAAREEAVLSFWEENGTFERSLEATRERPRYVFFEGPPTANGMPHFGHLMPRVYKDLFPRYKTMQGFHVARKGGWDTHGLPVELEVEKAIGVNSKPEIEAYGVERFVEKCKESVWTYKAEWERMIQRMGFWIDLENAYVTYTDGYIETVWWELKTMFDRGLLYQGHKTLPYCPRCGTGLSSHEVAQGYRTVEDPSVSIRMPVTSDEGCAYKRESGTTVSLLTWTTTPWTLPANVALALAAGALYVEVDAGEERLILAKELVENAIGPEAHIVREIPGRDLVGLRYEPPYRLTEDPAAHRVYAAGFVNMEDGTGIVHIASAFGEDDYRLGQEVGLPFVQPVDLAGNFTGDFALCADRFVKDCDADIIEDLSARGILYRQAGYEHEYPFCWRCDTPLLYYAMDSWYIETTAVKDQLIANNKKITWYPPHVGEGRLGKFLENLKDWALSRDRYWGTPLNLWVCDTCHAVTSVGSRDELVALAEDPETARDVELHRPYIDGIKLRCPECGESATRVPYVIDTWFDSGSMHTAQWHYPFENEERFRESFPADFICEAMEQTRGWYYTLLATSTIIHGEPPYLRCMSTGLGLDGEGLKMSKSKGNVADPWDYIKQVGADCIRWYFYSSSAPWKSKRLGEAAVQEPLYRFLDTLRNTYDFFALYATIDGYDPEVHLAPDGAGSSVLDRWIGSRLASTTTAVTTALDAYDVMSATAAIEAFVDDLSNWYVRLSRRRFWRGGMGEDKIAAYATLRGVLLDLAKLAAPFVPFLTEAIYRNLRCASDPESVHLCSYPVPGATDDRLEDEMKLARQVAALGHQARNQAQIRVRQPLARVVVRTEQSTLSGEVRELIASELNVEDVVLAASFDEYAVERLVPNFRSLGPRLGALGQQAAAWIRTHGTAEFRQSLLAGPVTVEVDGTPVEFVAEDVQVATALPEGLVEAGEGADRVLLDVRLSDDLVRKGLVREVMHRIQLARKAAGFDVTDRIILGYEADGLLDEVLAANEDDVAAEVLAVGITRGMEGTFEHTETFALDQGSVTIGVSRTSGNA